MDQRISLITLAVADVARSRAFYVDGLGWTPELEAPGVLMIRAGEHLLFSLWSETEFEEEVGPINRGPGVAPLTLAHNVGSKAQVDDVMRTARVAGADPVAEAVDREWGGYSGYIGDPDGYRWEIACAPGQVNEIVVPRESRD
jgi:catechol 2,3-dioxygenase-like lactoylglutathione lyase family enzyme